MIRVGPVAADRMGDFLKAMGIPFSFTPKDTDVELFVEGWDPTWLTAAYDEDERIVATFGSFPFEMQVPGGVLPTAGTTVVTVLPTHRRQGVLTRLMRDHLDTARDRGQAMAALWASEVGIYGRFGYGIASQDRRVEMSEHAAWLQDPPEIAGTMRFVSEAEALEVLPPIFAAAHAGRPGVFHRTPHWWRERVLRDPEHWRNGATAKRVTVHRRNGEDVAYGIWRTKDQPGARLKLQVLEVAAVDAEAERSMWEFLFGIDLVGDLDLHHRPVDDPLQWWLENPRTLTAKVSDALWVRPLDVTACLEGRRYRADGTLVLELSDPWYPDVAGRWRLTVTEGTGRAERTEDPTDVELSSATLGSLLLGGHGADLGRAGRLRGSAEAIDLVDLLFRWPVPPFAQEVF